MNIGGIVIEPVLDGRILSKLHATRPFPPADSPLMADQHGMIDPDGMVESTLGAFLVRTGDRVVLVDAGAGQPIPGGYSPPTIDFADPRDPDRRRVARAWPRSGRARGRGRSPTCG